MSGDTAAAGRASSRRPHDHSSHGKEAICVAGAVAQDEGSETPRNHMGEGVHCSPR